MRYLVLVIMNVFLALPALGHTTSEVEIKLRRDDNKIIGYVTYSLVDLEVAIGLDIDQNGELTRKEFKQRKAAISEFVEESFALDGCDLIAVGPSLVDVAGTLKARTELTGQCQEDASRLLSYNGFFDLDSNHKALVHLTDASGQATLIFDPMSRKQAWPAAAPTFLSTCFQYIKQGIWHIWIGFDHILFLITLLLPAVWIRKGMTAAPTLKEAAIDVAKIVTAFTIAHSITLSLVSAGFLQIESWLVESAIAASVLVAALNNIYPVLAKHRWGMAFAFGLIHGFGFASVLADLGWSAELMLTSVLGFNFGVEIGQLAIVALTLPALYLVRRWGTLYRPVVLMGGSAIAVLISILWMVDRILGLEFMPI